MSLYTGKTICHFLRALPARIWGHCSQILVFTSIWGTQKGCDNNTFRAVFPSIWVSWPPQTLQNKGKRKMTNRPCFTPPPVYPSRSTSSQAPRMLLLVDFGRKSTVIGPLGGGFNSTPGTYLNSTLGFA